MPVDRACLLWKNVFLGPLPIFKLGCLCFDVELYIGSMYILNINPFLDISFAKGSRLPLHFVNVSFTVQTLFGLL